MSRFYADLAVLPADVALCDSTRHAALPPNWSVVIVDIAGSTKAIEGGKYKDVNIVASCAIIAVLNALGRPEIPYIFGGDGVTILVPDTMRLAVAQALYGTRAMSQSQFNLDMRAGIVPMADLIEQGAPVRVAKFAAAPGVFQATLSGQGITLAEKLVKAADTGPRYDISTLFSDAQLKEVPANFEGLECRWKPLHSRNGLDVSIIIQARTNEAEAASVYRGILDEVLRLCGPHDRWRPASEDNLVVGSNPLSLMGETKVRTSHQDLAARLKYLVHIWMLTVVGKICFAFGLKAGTFDGKTYRADTARNTDYIKFDNALRLVMDVAPAHRYALEDYLSNLHAQGLIFYGMHGAPTALMTCMVFDYTQNHFHFIDGSDGGYAMAAKQLKAQIRETALIS
ncbi:MAG: DUF3095 domain-containing protein [Proteobacteria bacterium]|nr:DUF3095 domain-containing protein [Pseudomonadota bacterium]